MIAGSVRAGIGVLGVIGLGSLGFALAPVSQNISPCPKPRSGWAKAGLSICLSWKHQYCIASAAFLAYATPVNIRVTVHDLPPDHHRAGSPTVQVIRVVGPKVCKEVREFGKCHPHRQIGLATISDDQPKRVLVF